MGPGAGGGGAAAGGVAAMGMGAASGMNSSGVKYEVICSSCGKTTTVPFEPTPGRPIYCRDCLKKIEAGELQPVRMPRMPSARRGAQKKYSEDLGRLGIEFPEAQAGGEEAPRQSAPSTRRFVRSAAEVGMGNEGKNAAMSPRTAPTTPAVPAVHQKTETTPPAEPTLSLSALKPVEKTAKTKRARPKEEINISELREAIKASLSADAKLTDAGEAGEKDDEDDGEKEHLERR